MLTVDAKVTVGNNALKPLTAFTKKRLPWVALLAVVVCVGGRARQSGRLTHDWGESFDEGQ